MKPPYPQYGQGNTITSPPRNCRGFEQASDYEHAKTGCRMALTPEQATWLAETIKRIK